ncbi:hypothetical protein K438DRAFT_76544 [Mycena galopus ATCC 62051]|nr:hypothetical protein K438DRAFT_76544 [Mycena galopus ATCC 62051]
MSPGAAVFCGRRNAAAEIVRVPGTGDVALLSEDDERVANGARYGESRRNGEGETGLPSAAGSCAAETVHEGVVWCPGAEGAGCAGDPANADASLCCTGAVSSVGLRANGAEGAMSGGGSRLGGGCPAGGEYCVCGGEYCLCAGGGEYCFCGGDPGGGAYCCGDIRGGVGARGVANSQLSVCAMGEGDGLKFSASSSRLTSRAAAAFNARSSSMGSNVGGGTRRVRPAVPIDDIPHIHIRQPYIIRRRRQPNCPARLHHKPTTPAAHPAPGSTIPRAFVVVVVRGTVVPGLGIRGTVASGSAPILAITITRTCPHRPHHRRRRHRGRPRRQRPRVLKHLRVPRRLRLLLLIRLVTTILRHRLILLLLPLPLPLPLRQQIALALLLLRQLRERRPAREREPGPAPRHARARARAALGRLHRRLRLLARRRRCVPTPCAPRAKLACTEHSRHEVTPVRILPPRCTKRRRRIHPARTRTRSLRIPPRPHREGREPPARRPHRPAPHAAQRPVPSPAVVRWLLLLLQWVGRCVRWCVRRVPALRRGRHRRVPPRNPPSARRQPRNSVRRRGRAPGPGWWWLVASRSGERRPDAVQPASDVRRGQEARVRIAEARGGVERRPVVGIRIVPPTRTLHIDALHPGHARILHAEPAHAAQAVGIVCVVGVLVVVLRHRLAHARTAVGGDVVDVEVQSRRGRGGSGRQGGEDDLGDGAVRLCDALLGALVPEVHGPREARHGRLFGDFLGKDACQ